MDVRRTSQPLTQEQKLTLVSLDLAKAQERVLHTYEDELIKSYIETAFDHLHGPEGWLNGYCLLEEDFEAFAADVSATVDLPLRPVVDETSVSLSRRLARGSYVDFGASDFMVARMDDTSTLALLTDVGFEGQVGVVDPRQYRITLAAGWQDPAEVPSPLKQAILMLVGHLYQNREATISDTRQTLTSKRVEFGLQALAGRYRFSPDHS